MVGNDLGRRKNAKIPEVVKVNNYHGFFKTVNPVKIDKVGKHFGRFLFFRNGFAVLGTILNRFPNF
jgi:hypothetical protein